MVKPSDRVKLLDAVKTPIAFLTLALLVTETLLGGLAARASGTDFTMLVGGMLSALLLIVGLGFQINRSQPLKEQVDALKLENERLRQQTEELIRRLDDIEKNTRSPNNDFTDIFVGIVDEYQWLVDHVFDDKLSDLKDPVILGRCKGLVSSVIGFRRFSLALHVLLNGQIDDLRKVIDQIDGKKRLSLNSDDRGRIEFLLEGIRTALPGKIREAEFEEGQLRGLLRQGRQRRADVNRRDLKDGEENDEGGSPVRPQPRPQF